MTARWREALPWVDRTARWLAVRASVDADDATQEARLALWKADTAGRFDENHGTPWRTWASCVVRRAVFDYARNTRKSWRAQRREILWCEFEPREGDNGTKALQRFADWKPVDFADPADSAEHVAGTRLAARRAWSALCAYSDPWDARRGEGWAEIARARFLDEEDQRTVAKRRGVTHAAIQHTERKILKVLRSAL